MSNQLSGRGGNYNPTGKTGPHPPAEKTTNLNIRCSPEFKALLMRASKAQGLSQGDLVEAAVRAFLDQHQTHL
jgi:hypothetical protein